MYVHINPQEGDVGQLIYTYIINIYEKTQKRTVIKERSLAIY